MRIFIAIPLPDNIQAGLSILQDGLRRSGADIKWVNPVDIHITLRFLGDIDYKAIRLITRALREDTGSYASFDISISRIGVFPSMLCPQIIWAGVHEGRPACAVLQKGIERCLEGLGIKKEARLFSPHLTLGRIRSQKNIHALIKMLGKEKDFSIRAKIHVKKIVLFSSVLTRQGPAYSSLEEFPLPEVC
jgi:RNA 2',3'-cyclic 3'-phosphodiesterase